MSALRDFLIAPAVGVSGRQPPLTRPDSRAVAPAVGVLAPARDLPAAAAAVGLALARRAPAALVCLQLPGPAVPPPPLRAIARGDSTRLATSLAARGLAADVRGRLVVAVVPDDPQDPSAVGVARVLAAAGPRPTVLGVAARDPDIDVLLGAQDAIVVGLRATADPVLVELALAGAAALAPSVAALPAGLDPLQRALALAGVRAPRAVCRVVDGLLP
jgi:hypothetical protein